MCELKTITDPTFNEKWIVTTKGIGNGFYYGAFSFSAYKMNNKLMQKGMLENLINRYGHIVARSRDIIAPLTLKEYLQIGELFKSCDYIYNKKKNELVCQKQTK